MGIQTLKIRKISRRLLFGVISLITILAQFSLIRPMSVNADTQEKILFGDQGRGEIISVDPDGSNPTVVSRGYNPSVSPDGSKILYDFQSNVPGNTSLYDLFMRDKNGIVTDLTNTPSTQEDRASWSPDGQHILYRSYTQSTNVGGFFVMNADGTNRHQILPRAEWASYSHDGSKILSAEWSQNYTSISIVVSDTDGNNFRTLFDNGDGNYEPAWSPDGQYIAWRSYCQPPDAIKSCISVMNSDGSNPHDILETADISAGGEAAYENPAWSPDSSHIVMDGVDANNNSVLFLATPDGKSVQVIPYTNRYGEQTALTPTWAYLDSSYLPLDITPPVVSPYGPFTKVVGTPFMLTAEATDDQSGVMGGTYWVGPVDADPGDGDWYPMTYADGVLSSSDESSPFTDLPVGEYQIIVEAQDAEGNWSDDALSQLTVTDATLTAPTNLAAPSPTKTPALTWNAVSGATSYNVYRDGTKVASPTTASYTDSAAAEGTHSYYVTAVNVSGESGHSNTINVTVDKTRPTMAFTAPTSFAGPFSTGPAVTITASDASSLQSMAIHVYTSSNQLLTTCGSANSSQLAAGTMSCSLASLPNGTYYIKAGSFDNAGNNQTINSGNFTIHH